MLELSQFVPRAISPRLTTASTMFPAVVLAGPRRCGKTTLLRHHFPDAGYVSLEDPDVAGFARQDPRGFLARWSSPVILDEIQYAPELFRYIRTRIDEAPHRKGQWLITGSQEAAVMQGVTESMAGRGAVLGLLPFSAREIGGWDLLIGGYPEALTAADRTLWFSSYVQTFLERDVREMIAVRDLALFRRFLTLLASRHGQVLRQSELAAPLGVSIPTVGRWLDALQVTGQIFLLPPYFENLGKRVVKAPKVVFLDSGLLCHLLGIRTHEELERAHLLGPVFEGFVISEALKCHRDAGIEGRLFYLRDSRGFEVDLVDLGPGLEPTYIEIKAAQTVRPTDASRLSSLTGDARRVVLHRGTPYPTATIAPGVEVMTPGQFFGYGTD